MKSAPGWPSSSRRPARGGRLLALGTALACFAAVAQPQGVPASTGAPPAVTPEVAVLRDHLPASTAMPMTSDGRPMSELAGVDYRLWMGRGRTQFGVGVGSLGAVAPSSDPHGAAALALVGASPALTLGVRHHLTAESTVYADAYGTRTLAGEPHAGYVNAKVGVEWKPAKPRFGFEHGALGIHLDSGYRLALKAHHGGLGLYLRGQF